MAAQIELTTDVVGALLKSRGADWADVTRVTAYFKRAQDSPWLGVWRSRQGLIHWPVLCVEAHVCRDELLFEVELDALRPAG